ncbi:hypothetical protein H5410_046915 [Solanum commersonii]|uniref:Uncharacterized protein n=1 Tax=Solanum commersonii TaxID=4109 RepID=A0A9J5XDJ5_SOLCO|nr:hypothetical protein H5410_046915 [Solanum commersonii]
MRDMYLSMIVKSEKNKGLTRKVSTLMICSHAFSTKWKCWTKAVDVILKGKRRQLANFGQIEGSLSIPWAWVVWV